MLYVASVARGKIEGSTLDLNDIASRIRELNAEKEAHTTDIAWLDAPMPRARPFAKPLETTVTSYVEDLRSTLNAGKQL